MSEIIEDHRDGNGKLHRIGGPAVVYTNGAKFWYSSGKLHRRGGPAAIWSWSSGAEGLWHTNDHTLCIPMALPKAAHPIMELFL